jgi:hypothetical protein
MTTGYFWFFAMVCLWPYFSPEKSCVRCDQLYVYDMDNIHNKKVGIMYVYIHF